MEPQHFATALEWLIELTLRPVLDGATVDKEREVLFAEGWGQKSRILEWLYAQGFGYDLNQALRRELFPGSPFSLTILGERDSLEAIDAAAIETYYKAHYRPDNMVLIVAGNVTPATLAEVVTDRWASVPAPTTPLPTVPAVQLAMQGPAHAVVRGPFPTDQVRLAYGFSTPGRLSPDHWALELLGEYLALRLKRQVRYDLGLVYALWPEIMTYTDAGYLAIRTDGPRRDRDQILALIQQELHTLVEEGVVDADFTLARNARLGQAALAMEDNMARAGYLAEWAAVLPPDAPAPDFRAKLAAVTADDLARVAATYNVPERQFLAEHQPAVSGADLAWLAGGALLLAGAGGGALWWRRRAKAGGVRPAPHDSL